MFQINLPPFDINIKEEDGKTVVFDILRKRFVALTPEEWVRQHFVHYLISEKHYPAALMANEISLSLNGMKRRADCALYNKDLSPLMLIEFKAPTVRITQKVFLQIEAYNHVFHVPWLIVSNGINHFCCRIDYEENSIKFLKDIPSYEELCSQSEDKP